MIVRFGAIYVDAVQLEFIVQVAALRISRNFATTLSIVFDLPRGRGDVGMVRKVLNRDPVEPISLFRIALQYCTTSNESTARPGKEQWITAKAAIRILLGTVVLVLAPEWSHAATTSLVCKDTASEGRLGQMKAQEPCQLKNYEQALAMYRAKVHPREDDDVMQSMTGVLCDASRKLPVPREDLPPTPMPVDLNGCDSAKLYYGIKQKTDYVRARWCALNEEKKPAPNASPISGAAVLMMLYANGQGVVRNLPLATRFACEADGGPADLDIRVADLVDPQTEKAGEQKDQTHDICDDVFTYFLEGQCAVISSERADDERDQHVEKLIQGLAPKARQSYGALRQMAERFFDSQSLNEVDRSSPDRVANIVGQADDDWNTFAADIEQLVAGHLAIADAQSIARADAALNTVYAQVIKSPAFKPSGDDPGYTTSGSTIVAGDVQKTQRLWLGYRDAWAQFAADVKPETRAPILVKIIQERTDQLNQLLQADGGGTTIRSDVGLTLCVRISA